MNRGLGRRAPALALVATALFAALGGGVYASAGSSKPKIDGARIRRSSLPGNRIKAGSLPGNRIKPGSLPPSRLAANVPGGLLAPGSVTGVQVDSSTLGQVPSAARAETAGSAQTAGSALNAANAGNAETVDGRDADCEPGTRLFAGACWEEDSEAPATATAAAAACAAREGELPAALALVAFSQQPGIELGLGDEWSGDVTNVSGANVFGVVTVSATSAVSFTISTAARHFRCVIPLLG